MTGDGSEKEIPFDLHSELDSLRAGAAAGNPKSPSSELFRHLVARSPSYITLVDLDGKILFINRVRPGVLYEKVIGFSVYDFGPAEHRETLRACVAEVVSTGNAGSCETEVHLSDGRVASFETHVAPIVAGDDLVAFAFVSHDITPRKRALRALRRTEEKVRMAVDAAGVGLWSWDPRSDRVEWEDGLLAIFGLREKGAPRTREEYLALVHPDDRERVAERIARGGADGHWENEHRIVRPDGTVRSVMTKAMVLHDAAEGGDVALGAVIDVTEHRHRDEQLRQAQKLEAVGQLTAGIAHNFNNLLMGVLPNLELALEQAPPAIQSMLNEAAQAAKRAADLVRQLTTYAGRNRPSERRVEVLGLLAERTLALCRTTFDRRITFETHYESAARAEIDPAQIEQGVLNLLINARDALADVGGRAPRLRIDVDVVSPGAPELARDHHAAPGASYARIRVADNGIGMDAATLARIYEPFFTTKPVGEGTGLGLATTYSIVRENGGWMTCESKPGVGTTFSILFRCAERPRIEEPARSPDAGTMGGYETVLVVDDEAAIRDVVTLMLEAAGYTVKAAASGQAAIDLLLDAGEASAVALVLLDVSMPGIPYAELRRRLRELAPRARVMYFTGYSFETTELDDVVIEKPVTAARLLRVVRQTLDRRG